jgi:hypothetical protein
VRLTYLRFSLFILLSACPVLAQECPAASEKQALLRYLQHHKSNSTEADPVCVNRAFANLSQDKAFTENLIQLLDFERSTKNDDLTARSGQYPAISALAHPEFVPLLVKAITESDSELGRTNAAEALDLVYRSCIQTAVALLEREASKPNTTSSQQDRLRAAKNMSVSAWGLVLARLCQRLNSANDAVAETSCDFGVRSCEPLSCVRHAPFFDRQQVRGRAG